MESGQKRPEINSAENAGGEFPIRHIWVVDDELILRGVLTKALARAGFDCRDAEDAGTA